MVYNEDAGYYTTLVHACGYSYRFLPNLILTLFLALIMLLIWLILFVTDKARARQRQRDGQNAGRNVSRKEPYLTNFAIRFLYEVFFELCLCIMINLSYSDAQESTYWALCLVLSLATLAALVWITVQYWNRGASMQGVYGKRTLISSFWGIRLLDKDVAKILDKAEVE